MLRRAAVPAATSRASWAIACLAPTRAALNCTFGCNFIKGAPCAGVDGIPSRECLPAPNRDIDKTRFDLYRVTAPTNALGSHDRGPGARECVEDDVIATGAIPDRIRHHQDRFGCRMGFEVRHPLGAEGIDAWMSPDIRP